MKNFLNKINDFINESFFNDYHNWILWCPVLFSCGILLYFRLKYFNLILFLSVSLFLCLLFLVFKNKEEFKIFLIAIFIIFVGYFRISYYTNSIKAPTIKYKMGRVIIKGTVDELTYYQKNNKTKKRIIVKVEDIVRNKKLEKDVRIEEKYTPYWDKDGKMQNLPKYIRININNKKYQPKFGDYVEVEANLIPIQKQVIPGAYNLEREFYYRQIGGIAYNGFIKEHENRQTNNLYESFKNKAYNIRENINNRIINAIGEEYGVLVGSFITGIRGKISSQDYDDMTYAGLVHLIAISGLNMAIIMGFIFWIVRRILVQSEYLTLNFDIKKISAIFAIIFGFLYLSITGFPVSANRAYIMACLFFIGILIDREIDTMRFLAFSAILILFFEPQLVLNPAFQLSFFAVIGLIGGFKFLQQHNVKMWTTNLWLKPIFYIYGTIISSIITEISVSPLVIYHFNNWTLYNIFANLIAIPLTSFITLPFATISILLFPLNLEKILLIPAGWTIGFVLKISKYIVSLPHAIFIISSPSLLGLSLIIFGFLWFMLWEQKWRYFGIFLFILGIILSPFKQKINVIIDKTDEFIIIIDKNIYFSYTRNDYKKSVITKKFGYKNYRNLKEYNENLDNNIEYIFRNKDYIDNFLELNKRYKIFNKDYNILIIPIEKLR